MGGYDKLTTRIFDPDDEYIHSHAVLGVKESLMAEFVKTEDPERVSEHGFKSTYCDVENDFVLAKTAKSKARTLLLFWAAPFVGTQR